MKLHFSIAKAVGAALLMALATSSCGHKQWSVEGTVEGGEGQPLVLEASNDMGFWYPMDTVTIQSDGSFRLKASPCGYPEIYRLTLGGQSVYVPIDSLDRVNVEATAGANFGGSGRISGSASAERMQAVNDAVAQAVGTLGAEGALVSDSLKRILTREILADPSGIVSYYIVNKRIAGRPIFDFANKRDLRVLGAVANAYAEKRPGDPRTSMLRDSFLRMRRASASVPTDTIVAQQISLPEISLLDENGRRRSLLEEASHGKVIVLNFTAYGAEESPAFNVALAEVYRQHKDSGLEVFQVAFDSDEFFWRQTARNLPWATVYNSPSDGSALLATYNVQGLPTLFIVNRRGELAERVGSIAELKKSLPKYL